MVTNNTFQSAFKGAFTQLRFETGYVNEPLEVHTVHFLLETTSQVTVHACTGWVGESSSQYHSQTEIFSSWHRGTLDTHVIRKLVHMHEIDPLQCIQVFFLIEVCSVQTSE